MTTQYVCTRLITNICYDWQELEEVSGTGLFGTLQTGDGLKIGGLIFLCTLTAWGFREVATLILNRR